MSIASPTPSNGTFLALQNGIANFLATGDPLLPILLGAGLSPHLETFTLGLQGLNTGADVQKAGLVAWRFLAVSKTDGIIVDVTVALSHRAPMVAAVQRGPHAQTILNATLRAEKLPQVQGANYQLALLTIPALLIESLWLKKSGPDDWIIPFHTLASELHLNQPYSPNDFITAIQPIVKRRMAYED